MRLEARIERYRAIELARQRPLIVYATSTRANVPARMAGDVVREFIDQVDAIRTGTEVDVLIHSTGGDALAAWKLMSLLRERFERVSVLVPSMAFSAATIFALGADEIVMHPHASLGPIDPQISIQSRDGGHRSFSFEDVGAFLRFIADEVGLTEQAHVAVVIEKLFGVVDPVHVGGAKRASELSTDVGERLLQMHMKSDEERKRARSIAESLNKSFFAHGDAVSRSRARTLELPIAKDDRKLEGLIWDAYLGLEAHMGLRAPFNPLEHYLVNGGAAALKPSPPLVLPPNAPPQLVQQLWNKVAGEALAALQGPAIEVDFTLVNAVVESQRAAAEFRTVGTISANRLMGGEIHLSVTDRSAKWVPLPIPGGAAPKGS